MKLHLIRLACLAALFFAARAAAQTFDFSDIQVVSAASAFFSNDALYGDPGSNPNEFLQVSFAAGIASVIIEADPNGGSFVMDDLSYTPAVPEPSSLYLALTGVAALLALRKKLL